MCDTKLPSREILEKIVTNIANLIDVEKQSFTNKALIECCSEIGSIDSRATDVHLYHELAETALNLLIAEKYGARLHQARDPGKVCAEVLRPLQERLPTQSWRSRAQTDLQQFSTPAPIAFLLAYLVNLQSNDFILEPSAGTGSLAVWGKAIGATVGTNEIDPRRRELLKLLGFDSTAYNAEYIDDLLPAAIQPNVVVINPPFSSNNGRTRLTSSKFGFRHVESALRRLGRGGRFGVILGMSGSPCSRSGNEFWKSLEPEIVLNSVIEIDGREYYRNGTSVDIVLAVGKKDVNECGKTINDPITVSVQSVEEAFASSSSLRLSL